MQNTGSDRMARNPDYDYVQHAAAGPCRMIYSGLNGIQINTGSLPYLISTGRYTVTNAQVDRPESAQRRPNLRPLQAAKASEGPSLNDLFTLKLFFWEYVGRGWLEL